MNEKLIIERSIKMNKENTLRWRVVIGALYVNSVRVCFIVGAYM